MNLKSHLRYFSIVLTFLALGELSNPTKADDTPIASEQDAAGIDDASISKLDPETVHLLISFLISEDLSKFEHQERRVISASPVNGNLGRKGIKSSAHRNFLVIRSIGTQRYTLRRFYTDHWFPNIEAAFNSRNRLDLAAAGRLLKNLFERKDPKSRTALREIISMPRNEFFRHVYQFPNQRNRFEEWEQLEQLVREIEWLLLFETEDEALRAKVTEARTDAERTADELFKAIENPLNTLKTEASALLIKRKLTWRGRRPKFERSFVLNAVSDPTTLLTNLDRSESVHVLRARRALKKVMEIDEQAARLFSGLISIPDLPRAPQSRKLFDLSLMEKRSEFPRPLPVTMAAKILSRKPSTGYDLKDICVQNMRRLGLAAKF